MSSSRIIPKTTPSSAQALSSASIIRPPWSESLLLTKTVDEIVGTCAPADFVATTRDFLKEIYNNIVRKSHVAESLDILEKHASVGSFPPQILGAIKTPTYQFSKDCADIQNAFSSASAEIIRTTRQQTLTLLRMKKQEELDSVTTQLNMDQLRKQFREKIHHHGNEITEKNSDGTFPVAFQKAFDLFADHCSDLIHRTFQLANQHIAKEKMKKFRKQSALKTNTDAIMADANAPDISSIIKTEVARALRATHDSKSKKPKSESQSPMPLSKTVLTTHRQTPQGSQTYLQTNEAKCTKGQKEDTNRRTRKRKREWERENAEEVVHMLEELDRKQFNPKNFASYPPSFFRASIQSQTEFTILLSSSEYVDSLRAHQSQIFFCGDVTIPPKIMASLSLNGKFILHSRLNKQLTDDALYKLRRSIRISWFFRNKPTNLSYIPRFHVKNPSWEPPLAHPVIEGAIKEMGTLLSKQVPRLQYHNDLFNPNVNTIRQFLQDARYLVKITDKNLGLAVMTQEWYKKECETHLSNLEAYECYGDTFPIWCMELFSTLLLIHNWNPTILKYLQTTKSDLPRFYVIPKVHKEPWASRPIIPSHSWVTSRASEVVDYILQPLLRHHQHVLNSTKMFLTGLREAASSQTSLDGCILATGDVKAMYTNINPKKALEIIREMMLDCDLQGNTFEGISELLEFILENNFFQYDQKIYKQKSGLAMGTSCAPVVANLFVAYYENQSLKYLYSRGFLYYGRYIDDLIILFKGTIETLKSMVSVLEPPGLEIEWNYSTTNLAYLDVDVSIQGGQLVTNLYRKRLNKHMYIPYSSAHPHHVKKAFVKAERSRIALICSTPDLVRSNEYDFRCSLHRRGYPKTVLDSWFSNDLEPREKRTNEVYVLPSVYNPVWDYVNVRVLQETYNNYLSVYAKDLDHMHIDLILSLKRDRNLFDMFHRNNLTILGDS